MAITVDFLTNLGIDKEIAEKVFAERSKEISEEKSKLEAIQKNLNEKNSAFDTLSKDFEVLKEKQASAEDYEKKFNDLQKEIEAKNAQAEKEKAEKEKAENIANRFNSVLGEREFSHEAIKKDYLKKFGEALDSNDFTGKSDAEIFETLTKDDVPAFKNVRITNLPGANSSSTTDLDDDKVRAIMGLSPKK